LAPTIKTGRCYYRYSAAVAGEPQLHFRHVSLRTKPDEAARIRPFRGRGSSMRGSTIVCDAFHRRNQESALYQAERNVLDTRPASSTTWTCRSPVRTQQQRNPLRGCDTATWCIVVGLKMRMTRSTTTLTGSQKSAAAERALRVKNRQDATALRQSALAALRPHIR
jgi:hypothetical protein